MLKLEFAMRAMGELGPAPLLYLARYQLALRSGWLRRRTPVYAWSERPLAFWLREGVPDQGQAYVDYRQQEAPAFFFHANADLAPALKGVLKQHEAQVQQRAEEILQGKFRLFGGPALDLGFPPNWWSFPALAQAPLEEAPGFLQHWSKCAQLPLPADIKLLWEAARFGWVYSLARAYRLQAQPDLAQGFWDLVQSWRSQNKPNAGLHWLSAQEVALRTLALLYALHAFWPWLASDPDKVIQLVQMIAVHADRIPPSLDYARAQGNNHLLSEAVALYSVGLLLPELKHAKHWKRIGRRTLRQAILDQFMQDGGYVQYSTQYHRLALQVALWGYQLAALHEEPFDASIRDRLKAGAHFLLALVDPRTGRVPNWGHNDGSLVLPFTCTDRSDFRPVLQAVWSCLHQQRLYSPGLWDEACIWLGAPLPPDWPAMQEHLSADCEGQDSFPLVGMHRMGSKRSRAFLRAVDFKHRPAHSDQLHFDLWHEDRHIVLDAGTYLYNGAPPWRNGLAGAKVHNGPTIDEQEPMRRAGRFLWLDWSRAAVVEQARAPDCEWEWLVAEHEGYARRKVRLRRCLVRLGEACWWVCDDILGDGHHRVQVGWLLPDIEWHWENGCLRLGNDEDLVRIKVSGADQAALYRAGSWLDGSPMEEQAPLLGWYAPTYAYKQPALHLRLVLQAQAPMRLLTAFRLGVQAPPDMDIAWREPGEGRIPVRRIHFRGLDLDF